MGIKDFFKYGENFRLGNIQFPVLSETGEWLILEIGKLFRAIIGYAKEIDNIGCIIVFGSSVSEKVYKIKTKQVRKYLFFGKYIEKKEREYIKANDVDMLVITKKPMFDRKYIDPNIEEYSDGSCPITSLVCGGIDLINRSFDQVKEGLANGDTISVDALERGVILASEFDVEKVFGMINKNLRRAFFYDDGLTLNIQIK